MGPTTTLLRRLDLVEVTSAALLARAPGLGHRRIAAELGRPATTVRGWLRRFGGRAAELRALAAQLACRWDADLGLIAPRASPAAEAVEALGVAAAAFVRRFGQLGCSPWHLISGMARRCSRQRPPRAVRRCSSTCRRRQLDVHDVNDSVMDVAHGRADVHLEWRRVYITSGAQHRLLDERAVQVWYQTWPVLTRANHESDQHQVTRDLGRAH